MPAEGKLTMRCARIVHSSTASQRSLDEFLRLAEPDLLQLDFRSMDADSAVKVAPAYCCDLFDDLRIINKHLYLRPEFCVVTNAGNEDVVGCMESLANFLCEHDGANVPISGIRGDNLMPRLDELLGVELETVEESAPIPVSQIADSLLSMRVELGAGPLAVAMQEGARIVVAGGYDSTAPLIAGAVIQHDWPWEQLDRLARIAMAVRISPAIESMTHQHTLIEIHADGTVVFPLASLEEKDLLQIDREIRQFSRGERGVPHADVWCDFSDGRLNLSDSKILSLQGCRGKPAKGRWPLQLTLAADFSVVALLELNGVGSIAGTSGEADPMAACELLQTFCDSFPRDSPGDSFEVQRFQEVGDSSTTGTNGSLIRVSVRTLQKKSGEKFLAALKNWLVRHEALGIHLAEPAPQVRQLVNRFTALIPADAVKCSVDTRPAQEWL